MSIFNWDVFDPIFSWTEPNDYTIEYCNDFRVRFVLSHSRPRVPINITIPADNDALEGTEVLLVIPEVHSLFGSSLARNIFIQHTSIQINDTTGN